MKKGQFFMPEKKSTPDESQKSELEKSASDQSQEDEKERIKKMVHQNLKLSDEQIAAYQEREKIEQQKIKAYRKKLARTQGLKLGRTLEKGDVIADSMDKQSAAQVLL